MAANTLSEQIGNSHVIQIGIQDNILATDIREQLRTLPPLPSQCCIFRVPNTLRQLNKEAFLPRALSIGPFHHGKQSLQAMEVHKWQYLNALLKRKTETSLEDCVKAMRELEERTRNCYAETINLSSDEMVKMLILDGCFIIELFLKNKIKDLRDIDDPIFNVTMLFTDLHRDILLLENQLPLFVLNRLFDLIIGNNNPENMGNSILELTHFFFSSKILGKFEPELLTRASQSQVKHLLDLLRIWLVPSSPRKKQWNVKGRSRFEFICSVEELQEAGAKFKMGNGSCLMDIKFMNGVLEIPPLRITDNTDSLLRNLIALEQCCNRCTPRHITDYVILMENLINSPKDVHILKQYEIINNFLGDNREVSDLFKRLGKEVVFNSEKFYFSSLCQEVNAYRKTRWHIWQAALRRDYFKNPWAILSFIAAFFLLLFTSVQTVCSFLSCHV